MKASGADLWRLARRGRLQPAQPGARAGASFLASAGEGMGAAEPMAYVLWSIYWGKEKRNGNHESCGLCFVSQTYGALLVGASWKQQEKATGNQPFCDLTKEMGRRLPFPKRSRKHGVGKPRKQAERHTPTVACLYS